MKFSDVFKKLKLSNYLNQILSDSKKTTILVVIFIVLLIFLFNNKGLIQRFKIENEKDELIEKIEAAKNEQQNLKKEIKELESNPEKIEKIAREKYGMIKPGEKVYRVKPEEEK